MDRSSLVHKIDILQAGLICDKRNRKVINRPAVNAIVDELLSINKHVYLCGIESIMNQRFNVITREWEKFRTIRFHQSLTYYGVYFRTLMNGNIVAISEHLFYQEIDLSTPNLGVSERRPYFGQLDEDARLQKNPDESDNILNLKDDWEEHEWIQPIVHLHDDVYICFDGPFFKEFFEVDLSTGKIISTDTDPDPDTDDHNERFLYVIGTYHDLGDKTCLLVADREIIPPKPRVYLHIDAEDRSIIGKLPDPFAGALDHEGEGYALMQDGSLFTVGGRIAVRDGPFVVTNDCYRLNVKEKRWYRLANAPIMMEQSNIVCLPDGDMFVVAYTGDDYKWMIYHTPTNTWSDANDMPEMDDNMREIVLAL